MWWDVFWTNVNGLLKMGHVLFIPNVILVDRKTKRRKTKKTSKMPLKKTLKKPPWKAPDQPLYENFKNV